MDIQKILENAKNIKIEAAAASDAMQHLSRRKDTKNQNLANEFAADLTQMQNTTKTAAKIISTLPDEKTRQILQDRYLLNKTWEQTADDAFLSISHARRLHDKGIVWLQKNYR